MKVYQGLLLTGAAWLFTAIALISEILSNSIGFAIGWYIFNVIFSILFVLVLLEGVEKS